MGVIDRELLLAKMRLYFHMILADRGITNKEVTKVVRSMLDQVGDENIDVILELIDVIVKDPGDLNTICVTLEENRTPDVLRELFIDLLALSFVDKEVEKEVKLLDLIAVGLKISEKEVERDFNIFRGDFLKLRSDFSVLTIGGNDSEADVPFSLFQGKVVFMKIESRLFMLSINSAGVLINGVPLANNFHFIGFGEYDSIYCDTVHFGFDYAGIETLFKKKSLEKEKSGWIVRENSTMVLSETEHPESLLKFIHQKNRIYLEPLGEKWSIKLSGKPVDFSHPLIAFDSEPIEIIGFSNSIQISNVGTRNLSGSSDQVTEEIRLHEIDSSISEKIILKKINDQTRYLISISDWTNDILLNGEAVNSPFEIKHGDRIVAGNVFIRVDLKNPKKALFPFKIALSSLAMNSITARFKKAERNALENISFSLNAGDLGAVMGPAGSGKSTLLNSLLGGMKPASGFISVNGKKLDKGLLELQEHLGFVPQDDILIETLTAKENLYYTHKLMFPNDSTNREQTGELLLDILDKVGLREKADSIVGNIEQRLLSGGERKRLNIALELVSDPDILILDEPTSGLSSQDAEEIVGLLRAIADQGKMVLMVIHQPSSVIYKMIDTVLIINKGGKLAYSGSSLQALSLFNEVSKEPNSLNDYIECPACWEVNPNLLMKSLKTESTDFWQVVNKIEEEFTAKTGKQTTLKENSNQKSVLPAPRPMRTAAKFKQTWFQLKRQFKCKTRDRSNLLISFLAAPLIGFFSASVFQYSPSNQSYTLENNDQYPYFLFIMVLAAIFLGMTNSVLEIIKDRPILKRENLKNISLGGYFLSKFLVLSLFAFVQSILFLI
ncbi:ATP-binding cassette domain-containing protein, partial [bacterium]|nr:ATP-binding cassette domain-containing protein [bacterium]